MIRAAALLLLALGAPAQARMEQAAIVFSDVELGRANGGPAVAASSPRRRGARPAPQNDITATLEAMKLARTAYPHVTRDRVGSDALAQ